MFERTGFVQEHIDAVYKQLSIAVDPDCPQAGVRARACGEELVRSSRQEGVRAALGFRWALLRTGEHAQEVTQ